VIVTKPEKQVLPDFQQEYKTSLSHSICDASRTYGDRCIWKQIGKRYFEPVFRDLADSGSMPFRNRGTSVWERWQYGAW